MVINATLCCQYLAPVSASNTLHPAIAGEQLGVPAVASVVSDLVAHVLTELQSCRVDANLQREGAISQVFDNLIGYLGLTLRTDFVS